MSLGHNHGYPSWSRRTYSVGNHLGDPAVAVEGCFRLRHYRCHFLFTLRTLEFYLFSFPLSLGGFGLLISGEEGDWTQITAKIHH